MRCLSGSRCVRNLSCITEHGTDLSHLCDSIVLFIRHYSMKRTVVKEGRKNSEAGTPPDAVTPTTQVAGSDPSDTPQTIEEERKRSANDLEKGLNGSEDGSADVKDEKDEIEEEYVKKG